MTRKVMDIILEDGTNIVCIKDDKQKYNPFRVYLKFYANGGWHRRKLTNYGDINSVVYFLTDIINGRVCI